MNDYNHVLYASILVGISDWIRHRRYSFIKCSHNLFLRMVMLCRLHLDIRLEGPHTCRAQRSLTRGAGAGVAVPRLCARALWIHLAASDVTTSIASTEPYTVRRAPTNAFLAGTKRIRLIVNSESQIQILI